MPSIIEVWLYSAVWALRIPAVCARALPRVEPRAACGRFHPATPLRAPARLSRGYLVPPATQIGAHMDRRSLDTRLHTTRAQLNVRIDVEAVKDKARSLGLTSSELIRVAVEAYEPEPEAELRSWVESIDRRVSALEELAGR